MQKQSKSSRRVKAKRKPPRRRRGVPRAAAVEATLAALAHDIRTPLTGILALSELLTTSELGERERGWASAIKSTADHLAMLTSLIVDAARAQAKGLALRRTAFGPRVLAEALAALLAASPRPAVGLAARRRSNSSRLRAPKRRQAQHPRAPGRRVRFAYCASRTTPMAVSCSTPSSPSLAIAPTLSVRARPLSRRQQARAMTQC